MEVEDIMILEGYLTWDDVYGDGSNITEKKYSKLNKDLKRYLKELVAAKVMDFWNFRRLIPIGLDYNNLKKNIINCFVGDMKVRIKDEKVFNEYLKVQVITIINRALKEENKAIQTQVNLCQTFNEGS